MSNQDNSQGGSKLVTGLVVGLVAGLAAGLLFAPKSGKETREDIEKKAKNTKDSAGKTVATIREEIFNLVSKAELQIAKMKAETKRHAVDLVDQAKLASAKARDVMTAFKSGEASDEDLEAAIKNAQEAKTRLSTYIKKS